MVTQRFEYLPADLTRLISSGVNGTEMPLHKNPPVEIKVLTGVVKGWEAPFTYNPVSDFAIGRWQWCKPKFYIID